MVRQPQTGDSHWEPWGAATMEPAETNTTEYKPHKRPTNTPLPVWNHLIHLLLPSPVNQTWGRGVGYHNIVVDWKD